MRRIEGHVMKWMAAACLAVAEAAAQGETSSGRRIVVSIPDRRLFLLVDGRVAKTYSVAVGAPESPSPSGTFQIVSLVDSPTWYRSGKVVRPGPGNPLGPRWIGLSCKGYGIHGTNRPRSIGGARSHGCIRMRNSDVRELFDAIAIGDVVELRGEAPEGTSWY